MKIDYLPFQKCMICVHCSKSYLEAVSYHLRTVKVNLASLKAIQYCLCFQELDLFVLDFLNAASFLPLSLSFPNFVGVYQLVILLLFHINHCFAFNLLHLIFSYFSFSFYSSFFNHYLYLLPLTISLIFLNLWNNFTNYY